MRQPIKIMNNGLIDMHDEYNRQLRYRRIKRALAWCGIVAAGSLLVFCIGVYALREGVLSVLATLIIVALMTWGIWGFIHLKTRH